jgi:hypothetical protein
VNTVLWVVTALLAVIVVAVALMKLNRPKPALVKAGQAWAANHGPGTHSPHPPAARTPDPAPGATECSP